MKRNPVVQAAIDELEAVGIKPDVERTNGHVKVRWEINGNKRLWVGSSTPSDRLAHKKARCDIRRLLKIDGVSVE